MQPPSCTGCSSKCQVNSLAGRLHIFFNSLFTEMSASTQSNLSTMYIQGRYHWPATHHGCFRDRLPPGCGQVASARWNLGDDPILVRRNSTRGHNDHALKKALNPNYLKFRAYKGGAPHWTFAFLPRCFRLRLGLLRSRRFQAWLSVRPLPGECPSVNCYG